jgi:hypothetical protein
MAQEMLKEVELGGGKDDRAGTSPRAVAGGIKHEVCEAQVIGRPSPAEKRAHSREKLLVGERFHEIVVGAAVESSHPLFGAAQGCEQKDWKLCRRPEAAADADAVETGKHHVQDDQVGWAVASHSQSLHPIARELDIVSFSLEHSLESGGKAAIVFDHQNPGGSHMQRYISRL